MVAVNASMGGPRRGPEIEPSEAGTIVSCSSQLQHTRRPMVEVTGVSACAFAVVGQQYELDHPTISQRTAKTGAASAKRSIGSSKAPPTQLL